MKENQAIRDEAKRANVPLWKCALQIGISEPTIIRWLRVPLSTEKETLIRNAISELSKEAG